MDDMAKSTPRRARMGNSRREMEKGSRLRNIMMMRPMTAKE